MSASCRDVHVTCILSYLRFWTSPSCCKESHLKWNHKTKGVNMASRSQKACQFSCFIYCSEALPTYQFPKSRKNMEKCCSTFLFFRYTVSWYIRDISVGNPMWYELPASKYRVHDTKRITKCFSHHQFDPIPTYRISLQVYQLQIDTKYNQTQLYTPHQKNPPTGDHRIGRTMKGTKSWENQISSCKYTVSAIRKEVNS